MVGGDIRSLTANPGKFRGLCMSFESVPLMEQTSPVQNDSFMEHIIHPFI